MEEDSRMPLRSGAGGADDIESAGASVDRRLLLKSTVPDEHKRNLARSLNAFIVVALLATFITVIVVATKRPSAFQDSFGQQERFTFDDIFSVGPRGFSVNWLDGSSYTFLQNEDGQDLPNVYTQVVTSPMADPQLLLDSSTLGSDVASFGDFQTSFDKRRLILATDRTKIWRHSYSAEYVVVELSGNQGGVDKYLRLTTSANRDQQMGATLSPANNKVAFVRDNNIFFRDISTDVPEIQITFDGSQAVINGIHSWVYEEEIYGSEFVSMWWNPSGERLAFMRSDESEVGTFSFMYYNEDPYPQTVDVKYPTVGTTNPTVRLAVYDSQVQCTQWIDLSVVISEDEFYITKVFWADDHTLAMWTLDRLQQHERLFFAQLPAQCVDGSTLPATRFRLVREQTDDRWIDQSRALRLIDGTNLLLDLLENNGYRHVALTDAVSGRVTFLTSGEWDVTSIAAYRASTSTVFFFSAEESPLERHLYSMNLNGGSKTKLTNEPGWWSASFSPTGDYYLEVFGGNGEDFLAVPRYTLKSVPGQLPAAAEVIETNDELRSELSAKALPRKEFITVPNPGDPNGVALNAFILTPANYDSNRRYPIIVNIYGGPGSQEVSYAYDLGFNMYLLSQGYIVAAVDNRGTGARGSEFMKQVYRNLGDYETQDFITFGSFLRDRFNPTSLAIWGWSYGGYMTSKVFQQDVGQVYDGGVIVAPVTSWLYYDTVYTERYMAWPEVNPEGYNVSSVLGNVKNFADKKFLLIHGTADDNVHFHNAILLFHELIAEEIQFDSMIYPNEDHGIPSRRHLYRFIGDWFDRSIGMFD